MSSGRWLMESATREKNIDPLFTAPAISFFMGIFWYSLKRF